MQSVEPVLENAIKTLQKVVDVRGMGKKWAPWIAQLDRDLYLMISQFVHEAVTLQAKRKGLRVCQVYKFDIYLRVIKF